MKIRVSITFWQEDHFTILMILKLFSERSLELHTKSTILMLFMQNWDFSFEMIHSVCFKFIKIASNHWMCCRTKSQISERISRLSYVDLELLTFTSFKKDLHLTAIWSTRIFKITLTNCRTELIASYEKRINLKRLIEIWKAVMFLYSKMSSI